MANRRVVITGMGAITPLGNNVEEFWQGLKEGRNGIGAITKMDVTSANVKIAGEVKDFNAKDYMDFKSAKRMELFSQYAVAATKEAVTMADLKMEEEDPFRVGVIVGCGIGSMQTQEKEIPKFYTDKKVNPLYIPLVISNMAAAHIAIQFGMKGKNIDIVTACATGSHSIGEAYNTIRLNEADVMVAGGTEAAICPSAVFGFDALTALSRNNNPEEASRPFDTNRDGFVLGEGSGVLILEELEHAKNRGANIFAEIVGYGATNDAFHITSPAEDGSGAGTAMTMAIKNAGITPDKIEYINAHGTSTHHNDLFETRAIKYAFGEHSSKVCINSTKSMIGHLLGGAGGVEAIVCVKSILDGYVHMTRNSKERDEELDLDYTFGEGHSLDINYCMSNSLGFGGHNASLVFKKFEE